jgi:hypothetical protein
MASDIDIESKNIGNIEREFANMLFRPKNLDGSVIS